jgi:hypothetical protein
VTLEEIRQQIIDTQPEDWSELLDGPAFLSTIAAGSEHGEWRLFVDEHYGRAVLRSDVGISLAWGLTWREDFEEEWSKRFADAKASGHYADVLWHGQPVLRELYVTVDGGRYAIPLPSNEYERVQGEDYVLMPRTITKWQYTIGKLVHGLGHGGHDYDQGLSRASITVE